MTLVLAGPARSAEFPAEVRLEAETYRYRLYEVAFPSPVSSPFPENDTVRGHLYVPRRGEARPPVVLVLPIMAAPNVWIERRFVESFLRQGLAAMWIEMPYQFSRRPHESVPSGQVFLARTARRLGLNFRQSVADAHRAVTWLEGSDLVDPGRIGVFGISLGALVGSSLYASDARPRAALFALGGAGFTELVFASSMTGGFLRAAGITRDDLAREWKGLDPLENRERNGDKRVLLVNASGDRVIPAASGRRLKEAFPGARQVWVPGGHYTALLHMAWMPSYAGYHMANMLALR